MVRLVDPLDPRIWFDRIEKIAGGELDGLEESLRHACHLLQLTPDPFRSVVRLAIAEEDFEALLQAGAFDAAAHHLIAQPTALSIEEALNETIVRATIKCPALNRAIHGTGDTVATAVLAAWTTCLLALRAEYDAERISAPRGLAH